ncbi:MAG: glycosyltransferase [Marmoricola sp.]
MIGYYVHHVGRGHLHRALAVRAALGEPVTVLSSLPRPDRVPEDEWVSLASDLVPDQPAPAGATAGGRLHWAPPTHEGLRRRMAQVSAWIDAAGPRLIVVDVSVEVALLCRLHGVPVVSVMLPGRRTDPAHLLGFDIAHALVAAWPPVATPGMLPGLPSEVRGRVRAVGGLSRHAPVHPVHPDLIPDRLSLDRPARLAVLMLGQGGHHVDPALVERAVGSTPGWHWDVLDGRRGRWCDDPAPLLRNADVVVTHAGQNAVAEVAAARRPAVVVAQDRPHDEQRTTAAVLAAGPWPVEVEDTFPGDGWTDRLERVAALDGTAWQGWCDGLEADRFAALLRAAGGVS